MSVTDCDLMTGPTGHNRGLLPASLLRTNTKLKVVTPVSVLLHRKAAMNSRVRSVRASFGGTDLAVNGVMPWLVKIIELHWSNASTPGMII